MLISLSQISELVGSDRRTIKKRLGDYEPLIDGRAHLYESTEVLCLNADPTNDRPTEGEIFDLTDERARLAHHQANKTALEEDTLRGTLMPAELVRETWINLVVSFRAKMLGLPTKAAPLIIGVELVREVEGILSDIVYDALTELGESDSTVE